MHRITKPFYITLTSLALFAATAQAQQGKRALTFDDFAAVRGVSDPQLSPDGRLVLYALRTTDVEGNRRITRTMILSTDGTGSPRHFPQDTAVRATEARWSPDGSQERAGFESDRWRLMVHNRKERRAVRGWYRTTR